MNGRKVEMKRLSWLLGATFVALAAFGVYANTLGHGFVWDDKLLIEDNAFVQDWSNARKVLSWDFFFPETVRPVENAARPVWLLSALADCRLWGLFAGGHHLTNVLLHL